MSSKQLLDTQNQNDRQKIIKLSSTIDVNDRSSILFFGSKTQENMSQISSTMLEGMGNKDMGGAANSLGDMVDVIQKFDINEFGLNTKQNFFSKLFSKKPLNEFTHKYEDVRRQINIIIDRLEEHKNQLLTDIITLDRLYDANLKHFQQLEDYITAAQTKLKQLDDSDIPRLANTIDDPSNILQAQELRDLRSARDDLERRIHDLQLSRQVAMQGLPSIRLIQENDKALISKIDSTLVNTVPLWKNQLSQAIAIFRMSSATKTFKAATNFTNDLLESSAENLHHASRETREQVERGIYDVAAVQKANKTLVATINDNLRIADKGKQSREQAKIEIQKMEGDLRQTLRNL